MILQPGNTGGAIKKYDRTYHTMSESQHSFLQKGPGAEKDFADFEEVKFTSACRLYDNLSILSVSEDSRSETIKAFDQNYFAKFVRGWNCNFFRI